MKILLTSCSLLAGCFFYSTGLAQSRLQARSLVKRPFQIQTITQVQTTTQSQTTTRVAPKAQQATFKIQTASRTAIRPDSIPFRKLHGPDHPRNGTQGYNGHLLVARVPDTYNGHLLIKTPDKKKRHLQVVPPGNPPRPEKTGVRPR